MMQSSGMHPPVVPHPSPSAPGPWEILEPVLPLVMKPGRYAGNELHAIHKETDAVEVRFALAFPDVYEIGMSHLGLEILYHVLNRQPWCWAERVFSPWPDLEAWMRKLNAPLFTLESKTPVRRLDILGITLQYELHYANILNLIDLSGIPLAAAERGERDPLVIAGGPCAFNPEPLAEFLDAVVLGDGEEAAVAVAETVRQKKRERWSRAETLKRLAALDGVYVPSLYSEKRGPDGAFLGTAPLSEGVPEKVTANVVWKLKPEHYPVKPVVPLVEATHDRYLLEIMRGCTRGCRFCNAGSVYRPVRLRPVEELVRQAREAIQSTGYDEISLVSLSTSDYPDLPELLNGLAGLFRDDPISVSFPSLRPDTFTPEMADFASVMRKSGLTLAPEAGTQRLRDVINKNNTEDDLMAAVRLAYDRGWRHVKLYFMIGLPTETEADLEGLADLVGKVVALGRPYGRKEVAVSLSPFSPKAHTPFAWAAQDSIETIDAKVRFIRERMRWKEVKLSWRDPRVSRLETALGRGGRELAAVVRAAWAAGARFDAWTDHFRPVLWDKAFEAAGVDIQPLLEAKNPASPQPWDHLSKGLNPAFLVRERDKALAGDVTDDCAAGPCTDCGMSKKVPCADPARRRRAAGRSADAAQPAPQAGRQPVRRLPLQRTTPPLRIRMALRKGPEARFTSHLDLLRLFVRAFRRARIRLALSQGYHAHPRLSPGPPLPLGYTSRAEYIDFEVVDNVPAAFERIINAHLPAGIEVLRHAAVPERTPALDGSVGLAVYRIEWDGAPEAASLRPAIASFLSNNAFRVHRGEKDVDIRLSVADLSVQGHGLVLSVRLGTPATAKVKEVLDPLFESFEEPPLTFRVERTGLFIERQGQRLTPMEVLPHA